MSDLKFLEPGTKVMGLRFEFKNVKGRVLQQLTDGLVMVMFETSALPVITTRDNLKEVDYYEM